MAGGGWTYRDAGALAKAAIVLLLIDAALSALAAGAALAIGPENFWGDGIGLFQLARGLLQLATAIVVLTWLYRANANVRALGADDMMGSPGLGVGWFFIPLANLFMPYMTVRDIWKASAKPRDWQAERAPAAILIWWLLWIAGGIIGVVVFRIEMEYGFKMAPPEALWLSLGSDLIWVAASLLLAWIVRNIQAMQASAWPASVY